MKLLIIYHDHCIDGFTAAWAAHKALKKGSWENIELFPAQYGQKPPYEKIDSSTNVVIVDFSYKKEDILLLEQLASHTRVLDHHKTAEEELKELVSISPALKLDVIFDMNLSGAGLAWDYFMHEESRPSIIDLVEDRDLWKFKLADSKSFHEYIMMQPRTLQNWDNINMYSQSVEGLPRIINIGNHLLDYQRSCIDKIIAAGKMPITIDGNTGLACNCPGIFASDCGHLLANESGTFGATWSEAADKTVKFSLRSNGDYDVSAIAKKFGGGGHKNAAGFTLGQAKPKDYPSQVWSAEYFKASVSPDPLHFDNKSSYDSEA